MSRKESDGPTGDDGGTAGADLADDDVVNESNLSERWARGSAEGGWPEVDMPVPLGGALGTCPVLVPVDPFE